MTIFAALPVLFVLLILNFDDLCGALFSADQTRTAAASRLVIFAGVSISHFWLFSKMPFLFYFIFVSTGMLSCCDPPKKRWMIRDPSGLDGEPRSFSWLRAAKPRLSGSSRMESRLSGDGKSLSPRVVLGPGVLLSLLAALAICYGSSCNHRVPSPAEVKP